MTRRPIQPPRSARHRFLGGSPLGLLSAALIATATSALTVSACRVRRTDERRAAPSASMMAMPPPPPSASAEPPPPPPPAPSSSVIVDAGAVIEEAPRGAAAIALSGPGSNANHPDSAVGAVRVTMRALVAGKSSLDAVTAGVEVLENDPLLNAGTGSNLRLDARVELEAAVFDSEGHFGAVGALSGVKNPIRIARAVVETPHRVLVGDGARHFARSLGAELLPAPGDAGVARHRSLLHARGMKAGDAGASAAVQWSGPDGGLPRPGFTAWVDAGRKATRAAPATPAAESGARDGRDAGSDTVAVLVRVGPKQFAAGASSGGPALALPGRLGDVSVPGAALFVGSLGAVAVTGVGEHIAERTLARLVYDRLKRTRSADGTARFALEQLPNDADLAVAVLDARHAIVASRRPMAWAVADPEERTSRTATPPTPPGGSP